mmetsp:Transcript_31511/g.54619  ORF Transcript_31511/g.54619 Transcript_31511/m.54619 type:complete len:143 (-) Transcript_31511:15-443(-)
MMKILMVSLFNIVQTTRVGLLTVEDSSLDPSRYSFDLFLLKFDGGLEGLSQWVERARLDIVLDLAYSEIASYELCRLQRELNFIQIIAWSEDLAHKLGGVYPHTKRVDQLTMGVGLLKALNIQEVLLITNDYSAPPPLLKLP